MHRLHLRRVRAAAGLGALVALAGCAERRLVSAPGSPVSTGSWAMVWFAGALLSGVVGVLLTRRAWQRRGGASVAVALFTVQAGVVVVTGIVLGAVAVRSWQLLGDEHREQAASSLLSLSRADGDTRFFALMLVLVAIGTISLAVTFVISARFARGSDVVERWVAFGVLSLELAGCAFGLTCLVLGLRGWPYLGPALATPLVVAALVSCWPRVDDRLGS